MKRKELQKIVEEKAHQAADIGSQAVTATMTKLSPYVEQASEKVGPMAHDAKVKSAAIAVQALEAAQPHVEEALGKIAPAVEIAREKVTDDLMPKVTSALHDVAQHPSVKEAKDRVGKAAAALSGKEVVVKKKSSTGKKLLIVSLVGAAIGGAVVLFKKLTASKSGWEAHSPSPAYTPPTFNSDAAEADMTAEGAPTDEPPVPEDTDVSAADLAEGASEVAADLGVEVSPEPRDGEGIAPQVAPDQPVADGDAPGAPETETGGAPFRA